jgi:hypothetical protein
MRRLFLLSLLPVLLAAQEPATRPLALPEAENQYLEAWDARDSDQAIPLPKVARKDRFALQWLASAASQVLPANPFPRGVKAWKEAEAVRRFLGAPAPLWAEHLRSTPMTLGGSYLALWRWGKPRVRDGRLDGNLRKAWEDKLLKGDGPAVVRDLALRHALCFALAEADLERFSQLKDRLEDAFPDIFPEFQSAFSILGVPAPTVHVWILPGMKSVDLSLSQLGGHHVRIQPDPGGNLPELPADTAWVVPTRDGSQPVASSYLEGTSLAEAEALVPRLEAAQRMAYLAPVRSAFEIYALMYFPIQIDLDTQGNVQRILMGDAALAKRFQPMPTP